MVWLTGMTKPKPSPNIWGLVSWCPFLILDLTWATWQVSCGKQGLLTLPEHLSLPPVVDRKWQFCLKTIFEAEILHRISNFGLWDVNGSRASRGCWKVLGGSLVRYLGCGGLFRWGESSSEKVIFSCVIISELSPLILEKIWIFSIYSCCRLWKGKNNH